MINAFNSTTQLIITEFMKDNNIEQFTSTAFISPSNLYTVNESTKVFLPQSEFHSILIGSIIIANNITRYVSDKDITDFSATLNSSVDWYNFGAGYSFTYNNPISQIVDDNNTLIGYLTNDRKLYLSHQSGIPSELFAGSITSTSTTDGLKLLNSNGVGLYINKNGNLYFGNDNSNEWEQVQLSSSDFVDFVKKTDEDISNYSWVLDEDNMSTNSDTKVSTQQSINEYINNRLVDYGTF